MSVFTKLHTLFRANVRESVEKVTEANAIRIYRQEIVEAEALLSQRRDALAAAIATRCELEADIARAERRIRRREQQLNELPAAERSDELLQLAATEIAEAEAELEQLKQAHVDRCRQINREELALRRLLAEIRNHRRDLKLLEPQLQRRRQGTASCETISGRLAALRETRSGLNASVQADDHIEAGTAEAIERVNGNPVDRALGAAGQDTESLRVAAVLKRLQGQVAPA